MPRICMGRNGEWGGGERQKVTKTQAWLRMKQAYEARMGRTNIYSVNIYTTSSWDWGANKGKFLQDTAVRDQSFGQSSKSSNISLAVGRVGARLRVTCPEAVQILTRPSPACAPPASPHPGPAERRCGGQSTSCPAESCHHSRCRRRRSPAGRAHGQSGSSLGCMATGSPAPLGTMV